MRVALSGESALQRIRYDASDIVLLDVLLPGIDGFETCRQLKADPTTCDIPIIFMTSLASAEDKVRGFEAGAVDYVTKPLQQTEVLARITLHLKQQGQTETLRAQYEQLVQRHQVERARLLQAVAQQRDQLRAIAAKLTDVQERERQRLARELHDEMGQALTAIRMNLSAAEKELSTISTRAKDRLTEAANLTDQTLEQIRELSRDLRPSMLDDLGLIPTLRWYAKRFSNRTNIVVRLDIGALLKRSRLSPLLETALYRIVQESLTNVARHAEATEVLVHLSASVPDISSSGAQSSDSSSDIVARIEDNGCGFAPEDALTQEEVPRGAGLVGMRERVASLGGIWQLESTPGDGTQIYIRLPLEVAP
ncbi:response regulator [Chloroflexi bacterium TSY]|nr:response regulator [Chloroflexi bacterium TSY]